MRAQSWVNCLLGLWLIGASVVLSGRAESLIAAESVGGIPIAVLAYASAVGRPSAGISWGVAAAGLWTLSLNYGAATPSRLNAMVVGLVVMLLGTVNAIHRQTPRPASA